MLNFSAISQVKQHIQQSQQQIPKTELFDGAMTINLDKNYVDISELTQVPDNQIVFGHTITDQSIIIEVLERESNVDNTQAGTYFFTDLAHANECAPGEFEILEQIPNHKTKSAIEEKFGEDSYQCVVYGKQKVAHGREKVKNTVFVAVYILRLPKYNAEVLIHFNDPIELVGAAAKNAVVVHDLTKAKESFEQLIDSFNIVDYSIFG